MGRVHGPRPRGEGGARAVRALGLGSSSKLASRGGPRGSRTAARTGPVRSGRVREDDRQLGCWTRRLVGAFEAGVPALPLRCVGFAFGTGRHRSFGDLAFV